MKDKINIQPILLASDINVYSMARAFHEEYGIKSIVLAKNGAGPINDSKIINFEEVPNLDEDDDFVDKLKEIAKRYENSDIKLLLIGCADHYVRLIVRNRDKLQNRFIIPYTNQETLDKIVLKETFYEMCEEFGLDYPDTFVFKKGMDLNFEINFSYPVILKPSDSVEYWRSPFQNQHKVYKVKDREELNNLLTTIYEAGYKGNMIIQDMIPGRDENMYDLHVYTGKNKKVQMMALGNVLLEEHTPKGIGSNAATLSVYNEEIMLKVKNLLEGIGYQGWADCDLKYDSRDGKLKIFEINIRQGRSHYRITGLGENVAKYIVDDFILNIEKPLKLVNKPYLWYVVPRSLIFKYIKDEKKLSIINQLIKEKKYCHSLYYDKDLGLKRRLYLWARDINHLKKFKKFYK